MANAAATPKKINWAINAWIIGLLALVVGLTSFSDSFIGGLFYVLIAVITIPKTVSLIANTPKISFLAKWFVRYPLVFLFFIIAFGSVGDAKDKVLIDDFTKNNASIVSEIKNEIDAGEFSKANKTIAKYKDVLALYKNEDLNKLTELSVQKEDAAKKAKAAKALADEAKAEKERAESSIRQSAAATTSSGHTVINTVGTRVDLQNGDMFGIDEQTVLDINGQYIQNPTINHIKIGDVCTFKQGIRTHADQASCKR
jgi:hypothetical protein